MALPTSIHIGDYIRTESGLYRVISTRLGFYTLPSGDLRSTGDRDIELGNGTIYSESEIDYDDILLESEVEF